MKVDLSKVDVSLYVLVDPDQTGGHDPVALAVAAARGGATLIQLRDKGSSTRRMIALAGAMTEVLKPLGVPLIVDDRVDVALAVGAGGVHLGQDDMDPLEARRLLGPKAILGQTVKTTADIAAMPLAAVDYAAVGAVFATGSKVNVETTLELPGLQQRVGELKARKADLPVVAISGIDAGNAAAVIAAGADGISVISAVCKAKDPAAAAANLRRIVTEAGRARR